VRFQTHGYLRIEERELEAAGWNDGVISRPCQLLQLRKGATYQARL
jgi:hypothetical protein